MALPSGRYQLLPELFEEECGARYYLGGIQRRFRRGGLRKSEWRVEPGDNAHERVDAGQPARSYRGGRDRIQRRQRFLLVAAFRSELRLGTLLHSRNGLE